MKTFAFAAVIAIASIPSAVIAEDQVEEATAEMEEAALSVEAPIEALMADDAAKAVVTKHMGGQDLMQHPAYEQFKAMSLVEVQPWSQGAITDEMIANIRADLSKLGTDAEKETEEAA